MVLILLVFAAKSLTQKRFFIRIGIGEAYKLDRMDLQR